MTWFGGGFSPVFHPSQITDLVWLDATADATITLTSGRVSGWADKLGSGVEFTHATAGRQPIKSTDHGSQTIYFDGARNLAGNTAAKALMTDKAGFSALFILKRDNQTAEEYPLFYSSNGSASTVKFSLSLTATGIKVNSRDSSAGSTATQTSGYYDADRFHTFAVTVDKAAQRARIYRGGYKISETTSFGTADNYENANAATCLIGSPGTGANYLTGHVSQIFLLPREFTQREIYDLIRFADRHTQRQTRVNRLIVVAGDSIFANTYLTDPEKYYRKLHDELASSQVYVVNTAVDGRTLATLNTNRAEVTNAFGRAFAQDLILIHDGGSNDIATDTVDTATAQSRMQTYHDNIKTSYPSTKIVWSSLIARSTNGTLNTNLDAFTAAVQANQSTLKVDAIALTGDDEAFNDGADTEDTDNYTDGVHPTAAGVVIMAPYGAAAINTL